jgi:hypothetical protein
MIRKAKAVWRGTGRAGTGNLSTDSGVLSDTPYSFRTRFENEKGTNPEELIAAAHAGCFTMALAFGLTWFCTTNPRSERGMRTLPLSVFHSDDHAGVFWHPGAADWPLERASPDAVDQENDDHPSAWQVWARLDASPQRQASWFDSTSAYSLRERACIWLCGVSDVKSNGASRVTRC